MQRRTLSWAQETSAEEIYQQVLKQNPSFNISDFSGFGSSVTEDAEEEDAKVDQETGTSKRATNIKDKVICSENKCYFGS
ncbi:hypothetical protein N7462_001922 [Penicillium macrosclerotiorum]|uniref:uncharacterized protein n=1 Tax=Penicillium macrosclerotiorum TaxID=303699 RepID=UPI002546764B|nr:uncharacterized protein N7462_001922 [Penicillium macrosclerotiorum]KAJ5692499.1 hypothetical protein N7462_001922 [Penicillium macrosclerotiorum]